MHPAYSVIFFTTASGAGYGLWFWLGLRLASGGEAEPGSLLALMIGGVLVTLGLLSSTFHLGHPERAWRALSQWRSSWLSREGVAAVATYLPAGYVFLGLVLTAQVPGTALAGVLLALGSAITVWCTGMIYASLRTVPEWNLPLVPGIYIVLAGGTGAVCLGMIDAAFGRDGTVLSVGALGLMTAAVLKWIYWRKIDGMPAPYQTEQALAIPGASGIRPLDPPHTQPNFVMREMGYTVARRHARKLRLWAMTLLFLVPVAGLVLAALWTLAAVPFLALAVISGALGLWVERWLFFAEARHVSMLYYPDPATSEAPET